MRILVLVNDSNIGGAQRLIASMYKNWSTDDDVRLVCLQSPGALAEELERSIPNCIHLSFPPTIKSVPTMWWRLQREIAKFRPDVIHTNLIQSDFLGAVSVRRGAVQVSTVHTTGAVGGERAPESAVVRKLVAILRRRINRFTATDVASARFACMSGLSSNCLVIENGIDTSDFEWVQPEVGASKEILHVGRWHRMKGHDVLIRAFAESDLWRTGWNLMLVGPGVEPKNAELARLVRTVQTDPLFIESVRLLGPMSDIRPRLSRAACLVISSRYGETLPLVGMEACSAGVPVIATSVGSCSHFVVDAEMQVDPGNVASLTRAITHYCDMSPSQKRDLSDAVRVRAVNDFDLRARVSDYARTFLDARQVDAQNRAVRAPAQLRPQEVVIRIKKLVPRPTLANVAVGLFRASSRIGRWNPLLADVIKQLNMLITGADVAWRAQIGPGLVLYHPAAVVIGPYVRAGKNLVVQSSVTIGGGAGTQGGLGDSPLLGDNVTLGAGSRIMGAVEIGSGASIGANAVVIRDVPGGAFAAGVPARVVSRDRT